MRALGSTVPLLVGTSPRPVHTMVKLEEFDGRFGR
jgi:hypothetical protein